MQLCVVKALKSNHTAFYKTSRQLIIEFIVKLWRVLLLCFISNALKNLLYW